MYMEGVFFNLLLSRPHGGFGKLIQTYNTENSVEGRLRDVGCHDNRSFGYTTIPGK